MKTKVLLVMGLSLLMVSPALAEKWSVEVDYVDACSCNVICPCLFDSDPTNRECLGQAYLKVTKGHYGDVDLTGVTAHHAYKMGAWDRYTVSNKASKEQAKALRKVIDAALNLTSGEIVSYKQGPVSYKKRDGKILLSAEGSELELEIVPGADGKPIRMVNHPMFVRYEQYRAVKNKHKSENADFSNVGTNGFTAKIVESGES